VDACMHACMHTYTAISNLRNFRRTSNKIEIVWDPADHDSPNCGPVLYYYVIIVNSVDVNDMNITQSSEIRAKVSNLIKTTTYIISVAAVNRGGTGPTSTINITTLVVDEEGMYICI